MNPSELPAGRRDPAPRKAPSHRRRFAALVSVNRDINYLAAHAALHALAYALSGTFWTVFLLRGGVAPAGIFLAMAGTLALRFLFRPLVLAALPTLGPRRTLILGCILSALQYPALALVHGPGMALVACCVVTAFGSVFYWTCYHAFFAALGDAERRGNQLGWRQALGSVAGVIGPALGGVLLAVVGPWAAFGSSALLELGAALPLLAVAEPGFLRTAPHGAYAAARAGVLLFFSDGWITACSSVAWDVIAFRALGGRFDAFGWLVAGAALAGACGGMIWGRVIDAGHARRAVWANAVIFSATLLFKSTTGDNPLLVIAAATLAAALGGLYIPSLMTAVYNEAKASPCPMRFHFAAEGGWDAGGASVCLIAAALTAAGVPLAVALLLALPGIGLQARWLDGRYRAQRHLRLGSAA